MRLQRGAGLRDSVVMHHRGIGAIGGDGVKAFSQAERLLLAQGGKHLRYVAFGYGFPARHLVLQGHLEAHHGNAVFHMGVLDVFNLDLILNALELLNRFLTRQKGDVRIRFPGVVQGIVQPVGLIERGHHLVNRGDGVCNVLIGGSLHPLFGQRVLGLLRQAAPVDKQRGAVRQDQAVGHGDRRAGDVVRAQVQKPGDAVQAGNQHGICALFLEFFAELGQLFRRGFARVFHIEQPRGGCRRGRTALPQRRDEVDIADRNMLLFKGFVQFFDGRCGGHHAVHTHHAVFRKRVC